MRFPVTSRTWILFAAGVSMITETAPRFARNRNPSFRRALTVALAAAKLIRVVQRGRARLVEEVSWKIRRGS